MMSGRVMAALGQDRRARKKLRRGGFRFLPEWSLLDVFPDAALVFDDRGDVVGANAAAAALFGTTSDALIGSSIETLFPNVAGTGGSVRKRLRTGPRIEHVRARRSDGLEFPVEVALSAAKAPGGDVVIAMLRDASARFKADALKAAEKTILEMIAAGARLSDVLLTLVRSIEAVSDGMKASVLIMDAGGRELIHGAASSLPEGYVSAVARVPVGPSVGSCGTAAHRKELVVVRDIASDPLWANYRDVALSHGLRACWSSPILAGDGSVLGTFALYYSEPKSPSEDDLDLVQRATHLAGIAIERHHAEKLRQATEGRYRMLSELTSDFAYSFAFDEDGSARVEWATDAFSRITGYETEEWEAMGAWRGLVHPDDLLAFERRLPRLLRGEEVSSDVRIVTKSGDVRWLSVYSRPVWNDTHDRIIGVVGAAQDFTTRKEAEDAKTMFLATASHELKTPLTVIQGFAQLIGDERATTTGVHREAAETIERRARELNRILERILLSSRIEAGKTQVTLTDVDLSTILSERVAALGTVTGREVLLHLGDPQAVRADADVVTTVVDHLLDNAVKYSPDGGPIRVAASTGQDLVWVTVADRGIGMTPEQVARCFEKFWQAESSDVRRFGGTGIGLFIVRSLVEAMGGEIRVQSELGAGSTFSFSLRTSDTADGEPLDPGRAERTSIHEFMKQIGIHETRTP